MSVLSLLRYRQITGDDCALDGDLTAAIDDATAQLAEALCRVGIEQATYTERLRVYRGGHVFPSATPVTSTTEGAVLDTATITGATPDDPFDIFLDHPFATVTYVGGWEARDADPAPTHPVPVCIERDLAFAAYQFAHPQPLAQYPVGATSVRLGDAAVTFARPVSVAGPVGPTPQWSRQTMRYRSRRP